MANPLANATETIWTYSVFSNMADSAQDDYDKIRTDKNSGDCVVKVCNDGKLTFSISDTNAAYSPFWRTGRDRSENNAARRALLDAICLHYGFSEIYGARTTTPMREMASRIKALLSDKNVSKAQIKDFNFGDFDGNGKPLTLRRVKAIMDVMGKDNLETNVNGQGTEGPSVLPTENNIIEPPPIDQEDDSLFLGTPLVVTDTNKEELEEACCETGRRLANDSTELRALEEKGVGKTDLYYAGKIILGIGCRFGIKCNFSLPIRTLFHGTPTRINFLDSREVSRIAKILACKVIYDEINTDPFRDMPVTEEIGGKKRTMSVMASFELLLSDPNLRLPADDIKELKLDNIIEKCVAGKYN